MNILFFASQISHEEITYDLKKNKKEKVIDWILYICEQENLQNITKKNMILFVFKF